MVFQIINGTIILPLRVCAIKTNIVNFKIIFHPKAIAIIYGSIKDIKKPIKGIKAKINVTEAKSNGFIIPMILYPINIIIASDSATFA